MIIRTIELWISILLSAALLCGGAPTYAFPPQTQDGPALLKRLQAGYSQGRRSFTIPPGVYAFPAGADASFTLTDWSDAQIRGTGVTLLTNYGGVKLNRCRNVTLTGITIDNDPSPTMQGVVKAVNPQSKTLDITLNPAYQLPPEGGIARSDARFTAFYPPDGRDPVRLDWDATYQFDPLGGNAYRIKLLNNRIFDPFESTGVILPGDGIVIAVSTGSFGFHIKNCEHVTLRKERIYAATGFAIFDDGGPGGNVYDGCVIGRKPGSNRLLSCLRDGLHSYRSRKGPTVENCDFSYTGDDLIAIHGFLSVVESQPAPDRLIIASPFGRDIDPGMTLKLYDLASSQPRGQVAVASVTQITGPDADARIQAVPAAIQAQGFSVRSFPSDSAVLLNVKLDSPVNAPHFTLASSGEYCGNGAIVRNNYLHDNNSRGVLVKANNVTIEHNTIARLGWAGIAIFPESYYLEGPFVHHVIIRGNTISDGEAVGHTDGQIEGSLGSIAIANSFGKRLFHPPTYFGWADNSDIKIEGNHIIRPGEFGISLLNSLGITITNNVIEYPHQHRQYLKDFDLRGTLQDGSGPFAVSQAGLDVMRHPVYGNLVVGSCDVIIRGNAVKPDVPGYRGDWGIGVWTKSINVKY